MRGKPRCAASQRRWYRTWRLKFPCAVVDLAVSHGCMQRTYSLCAVNLVRVPGNACNYHVSEHKFVDWHQHANAGSYSQTGWCIQVVLAELTTSETSRMLQVQSIVLRGIHWNLTKTFAKLVTVNIAGMSKYLRNAPHRPNVLHALSSIIAMQSRCRHWH